MKVKKVLPLVLAASMAVSSIPVFADTTLSSSGATGSVPVTVSSEAPTFSVTVPTSLPIGIDEDGGVTTATDAPKIVNNSVGPVRVSNLTIQHSGDWATVDYAANKDNLASDKVGTKHVAVTAGAKSNADDKDTKWERTTGEDAISFTQSNWDAIAGGGGEFEIGYDAYIPLQDKALNNVEVAQLIFTISWDTQAPAVDPAP